MESVIRRNIDPAMGTVAVELPLAVPVGWAFCKAARITQRPEQGGVHCQVIGQDYSPQCRLREG